MTLYGLAKRAVKAITTGRYSTALNLLSNDERFSEAVQKLVQRKIRQECSKFSKSSDMKLTTTSDLESFNIQNVYAAAEEQCPTTITALRAISYRSRPRSKDYGTLKIAAALGILMNERNRNCNAVQKLIGVMLYKGKLNTQVKILQLWFCTYRKG